MFVSPCTLRSTQCAALIAVATVAGIARVETPRPAPASGHASDCPPLTQTASCPADRVLSYTTPTWNTPWLNPAVTLALWFLSGADTRTTADLTPASAPALPFPGHLALAPAANATCLPDTTLAPSGIVYSAAPRPALCTRAHLIPFAVGPPAHALNHPARAVGTAVPANATVRCSIAPPSVRSPFCFVARLACPEFSGPSSVGPSFPPSSALRGEPARLSVSLTFRPSLGAFARPGHGRFLVLT